MEKDTQQTDNVSDLFYAIICVFYFSFFFFITNIHTQYCVPDFVFILPGQKY